MCESIEDKQPKWRMIVTLGLFGLVNWEVFWQWQWAQFFLKLDISFSDKAASKDLESMPLDTEPCITNENNTRVLLQRSWLDYDKLDSF